MMIAKGIDVATVSKRLGHGSVAITVGTYTHAIKKKDKIAAEVLYNIFAYKSVGKEKELV